MTDDLREAMARAMFAADEASREAVTRIRRMGWDDIGDQYRNNWRERADAALAAIEASGTHDLRSIGKRWRHKKRGTTYRIAEPVTIQCETPIRDAEVLVAYRADADGTLWARRPDEFYDGRFEAVAARPRQPGSGAPAADG